MIDLDRMEEELAKALTVAVAPVARPSAPRPAPAPRLAQAPVPAPIRRPSPVVRAASPAAGVPELLELGLVQEADARISAATDRRDAVTWATMRALLDDRRDDVRVGLDELSGLARAADDREAWDRYWAQRFWAALEWGPEEERYEVLDQCRVRAYRFDDLTWWGNLTLLLAAMGKQDEATRAFDAAQPLLAGAPTDARRLDVVTNLVEAAATLADPGRVASVARLLRWPEGRLVVVGPGVVCKGSVERYRALGHAALGQWGEAAECFRSAESTHRAIGAAPLLARTLQQASGSQAAA